MAKGGAASVELERGCPMNRSPLAMRGACGGRIGQAGEVTVSLFLKTASPEGEEGRDAVTEAETRVCCGVGMELMKLPRGQG
jgi:hypothetical protein